jgi:glucose/arabinose dehydrogenase
MRPMTRHRSTVVILSLMAVVTACAAPETTPSPPGPTLAPATRGPAADSPSSRPSPSVPEATPDERSIDDDPGEIALEEVARGIAEPVNIAATPDGWLLVNERAGRVVAVAPRDGTTSVALDITDRVGSESSEQGLLGLALHPAWPQDARAFVNYTDREGHTVVSEFRVTDEPLPPSLDISTERVLLRVEQPFANHNGGQLAFGPDGTLYMGLGDGGSGGDPDGHGQNPATLLGSILRIDVDRGDPYAIPDDNPFADGDRGRPEVFLIGLRNPWRFSFDRETELLWIGDVGQNAAEEIDRVDPVRQAGANLGWDVMEASHCFDAAQCATEDLVMPVAEYGREFGCSVTGGYVYRGNAIPALWGWYLFSDYCTGSLFGVRADEDGVVGPRILMQTGGNVSTFGEDADGELYLADLAGGAIYRIVGED